MSNELAEVYPNTLSFMLSETNQLSLTLKNNTDKFLLYKFLINTRGVLLAKPPTSFIPPSQSVSVDVYLINNNLPIDEYNKTKILIMFIECNEEIKSIDEAKKKFQLLKNEENEKQEILVNLKIINKDDEGQNEENEKITYVNYAQLKSELEAKNNDIKKEIEINRKRLENLMSQENKYNNNLSNQRKKNKYYNMDNLIFIFLILIGLIIGANFACGYNKLFKKNK